MKKTEFSEKTLLFHKQIGLKFEKEVMKCCIWSIACTLLQLETLRKLDHKYVGSFGMWCWRRMEKISWRDYVRNDEELQTVKEERKILHATKRRNTNWIGHSLLRNYLVKHVVEGNIEGKGRGGMRRKQLPDDLKETRKYYRTLQYRIEIFLGVVKVFFFNSLLTSERYIMCPLNYENRVLASPSMSIRPFVRTYGTLQLPVDGFSRNLIFENFSKICRENSIFIQIQKKSDGYFK